MVTPDDDRRLQIVFDQQNKFLAVVQRIAMDMARLYPDWADWAKAEGFLPEVLVTAACVSVGAAILQDKHPELTADDFAQRCKVMYAEAKKMTELQQGMKQ